MEVLSLSLGIGTSIAQRVSKVNIYLLLSKALSLSSAHCSPLDPVCPWISQQIKSKHRSNAIPSRLCAMRKKRETTLTGSKDFNKSPSKRVSGQSGLQDKDSGALLFLAALSRERSRVYKHKSHKHFLQSYSYNFHQSEIKDEGHSL